MSEFNILYRSLHCEKNVAKKAEKPVASSQAQSEAKSESAVNPFRALLAKIF